MNNFIQNVSKIDITRGHHFDAGENSMLIQILDPGEDFPIPLYNFKEIHKFEFLDIEEDGFTNMGDGEFTYMGSFAITDEQAKEIAQLLKHAKENHMNVVVHCHAGIFRSGAVTEVGVIMGFVDTESFRCPNRLVKQKLLKALNMPYKNKEPMTINGKITTLSETEIIFARNRT
jgi:predicted protein tyrosine phosphatase